MPQGDASELCLASSTKLPDYNELSLQSQVSSEQSRASPCGALPTRLSRLATTSGAERPPPDHQCGPHREQQMNAAGGDAGAEEEHGPEDQRAECEQQGQ